MIRAVFFDVDDTLLDFDRCAAVATRRCFDRFCLPMPEQTMEVFFRINHGMWRGIEEGTLTLDEHRRTRWQRILKALGVDFDGPRLEEAFREELTECHELVDGASELLCALKGKCRLYLASNAADAASQRRRLAASGLADLVDGVFLSGELGVYKPSAEFFRACFARLGDLLPRETLMVGDSPAADMAGGKAFGMHTCLFDPKGFYPRCEDADVRVTRLLEVEAVLKRLAANE